MEFATSWNSKIHRCKSRGHSYAYPPFHLICILVGYCLVSSEATAVVPYLSNSRDSQGTIGLMNHIHTKSTYGENEIPVWKLKKAYLNKKEGYLLPHGRNRVLEQHVRHTSNQIISKKIATDVQPNEEEVKNARILAFVHSSTIKISAGMLKVEKKKVICHLKQYLKKNSHHTLNEIVNQMNLNILSPTTAMHITGSIEDLNPQIIITEGQHTETQEKEAHLEEKMLRNMKSFLECAEYDQLKNINSYIKSKECEEEKKMKLIDDFQFILSNIKMDHRCWEYLVEKIKCLSNMDDEFERYKKRFWENLQKH